jgi:hypothetical protein
VDESAVSSPSCWGIGRTLRGAAEPTCCWRWALCQTEQTLSSTSSSQKKNPTMLESNRNSNDERQQQQQQKKRQLEPATESYSSCCEVGITNNFVIKVTQRRKQATGRRGQQDQMEGNRTELDDGSNDKRDITTAHARQNSQPRPVPTGPAPHTAITTPATAASHM